MKDNKSKGIKEMWEYKVSLAKYVRFLSDNGMNESTIDNHLTEVKIDTVNDFNYGFLDNTKIDKIEKKYNQ